MANRTVKDANSVKGTNPQYLIEKITRTRIYESRYWKEECFGLSAALIVDKAMQLKYIGGVYSGNVKPTPFLCLVLKLLQIQPEKDIIIEFIKNEDFKYVRLLGAIYMRITGTSLDCYKYLEPLYLDYRKIRKMNRNGEFEVSHVDEVIDELLREERVCDVIMPRIQKRSVLEDNNQLEPRISGLDEDMDLESEEEEENIEYKPSRNKEVPLPDKRPSYRDHDKPRRSPSPRYKRSRSRSPRRRRSRDRERTRDSHRERRRDGDRDRRRSERDRDDRHKRRRRDESDRSHRHHRSDRSDRNDRRERRDRHGRDDIAEANALRAKLGMAPLRP